MIALDKFVDMLTANLELQNEYVVVFVFAFVILPIYIYIFIENEKKKKFELYLLQQKQHHRLQRFTEIQDNKLNKEMSAFICGISCLSF